MDGLFPTGWTHYLAGGVLIGVGVAIVFVATGLRAGASAFFTTTISYITQRPAFQRAWMLRERTVRTVFAVGLIAGAALFTLLVDGAWFTTEVPLWRLGLGGVFVGFGTRLSRGCTSGHGICGMSSCTRASLVAVPLFLGVAIATAFLLRPVLGP